ncbi:MAG: DUF1998 domain-containing protein [Nitrospirae bacterium]|nr:DUF1998 domain-containing protein [Nitrospirota bacterium]
MPKGPLRRAQLIAPFGVGAMVVVRDGTSVISGGLDHWFERESGEMDSRTLDIQEFIFEEWRLQRLLRVHHFCLPPDFREKRRGQDMPNCYLTMPFLRFPQWHFCRQCYRLEELPLSVRGRVKCRECQEKGRNNYLVQVPFIAMCDQGHIQDFPWREWVHRSMNPDCKSPLRLIATGGASLAAQKVKCDCGAERNLSNITETSSDRTETFLSKNLDNSGALFLCGGGRPWLGSQEGELCTRPLRGSLRSASNVYFADIRSAIYLPRGTSSAPSELVALMEGPPLSTLLTILAGAGREIKPEDLRNLYAQLLRPYSDAEIASAINIILSGKKDNSLDQSSPDEDQQIALRRAEFNVLRSARNDSQLLIKAASLDTYERNISGFFSKLMLVEKLRETRVLAGFTRAFPESDQTLEQKKAMLWRNVPQGDNSWLPAYIVYGEGIFLELNEERLQIWEKQLPVMERVRSLTERYQQNQRTRGLRVRQIGSRFIFLHTLAHLLMNQLTFECGYSSASLRERLYVSETTGAPMAGILIYTAAGDAEGTMGGLVRMGKQGYFEPMVLKALERASWCSADPVCMEMGGRGGQGPDNCNLAACHNCGLVPETACEEFNRFLDRALVIGSLERPDIGYFSSGDLK